MTRTRLLHHAATLLALVLFAKSPCLAAEGAAAPGAPNIVLIMTDDQGWGQTGYYNHPVLKTPHLDAMAANGLRFDRFYAGAPVCSPTRASVFTGRANDRAGVPNHGHALRLQEKTLPAALQASGYATGHFGKWHLNGLRGPGVPVLGDDTHRPGAFGFETWLTVTNFFDIDPLMSRGGVFEAFEGDTSAIIVREAMAFIAAAAENDKPFLAVIWDGSPHGPWRASAADRAAFAELNEKSQHHYGELVAFDRSVGVLRRGLRDLGVADNTLVWFCSDNGGLATVKPGSVGGLWRHKGSVWEGGLRVPSILEWPARITPRITNHPASTMDIFPTLVDLLGLPASSMLETVDGVSLVPLLSDDLAQREQPIPFRFRDQGALLDNRFKLVTLDRGAGAFQLFDLERDPKETTDISEERPRVFAEMKSRFLAWSDSVDASIAGKDYPEGRVNPADPEPRFWAKDERYKPFFEEWKDRPEYAKKLRDLSDEKASGKRK